MDMRSQFLRHQRRHLTACLTRRHAIWPCPRPVQPILYRVPWSKEVISQLITDKNPNGTITNSDLELAGGLLHLKSTVQSYDVRERTIDSKTGNLATTFWQRKGSASTDKAPAHLLRLHGIHQRIHRYVARHDYMPGVQNWMADDASRLFHLSDKQFLSYFNYNYPQKQPFKLVTLPPAIVSSVISALLRQTCSAESLRIEPIWFWLRLDKKVSKLHSTLLVL